MGPMDSPSSLRTMSLTWNPALAAGLSGTTATTWA